MNLTTHLSAVHRHCDDSFAALEQAVRQQDWAGADALCASFCEEMAQHFADEENRLFQALEAATGMRGGPTAVMRYEHEQMRELMEDLNRDLLQRDARGVAATCDTLLVLMQQHNMKEENILYPMCDSRIPDAASLLQELRHVTP